MSALTAEDFTLRELAEALEALDTRQLFNVRAEQMLTISASMWRYAVDNGPASPVPHCDLGTTLGVLAQAVHGCCDRAVLCKFGPEPRTFLFGCGAPQLVVLLNALMADIRSAERWPVTGAAA